MPFHQFPRLNDKIRNILGAAPDDINLKGITRFSTNGQPSNTDGWVTRSDDGVFHFGCWRQGISGSWATSRTTMLRARLGFKPPPRKAAVSAQERKERAHANETMWNRAGPLLQTSPAGSYLLNRGLALIDYPIALRMASLTYYEKEVNCGTFATMLGAVSDHQGALVSLHRTFLTIDGQKASVGNPKKLTRTSAPLAGASIKLYPPQIINNKLTLGVAEGIETALACWLGSAIPTWSCVSANGMRTFTWPPGLESLIIFADNDKIRTGQAAALALAARAVAAGIEVRVLIPTTEGADWLDIYNGEAE